MWVWRATITIWGICTMEFIGKHNPKFKDAVALKKKPSKKNPFFLLEGFREIYRALVSGYECERIFCASEHSEKEQELMEEIARRDIEVHRCREESLGELSYKEHPDHFVAVMRKRYLSQQDFLAQRKNTVPFYMIVEQVEKPGNVGALLRIADAAGVDGVILCDPVIDLFNPNLIRASLGTLFSVPIFVASLSEVWALIHQEGWRVFVTTPSATSMYYAHDYREPIALVFGSEKDGVTQSWKEGDFPLVALPMFGLADSLNLSTAVSAVVYEVVRQRSFES